MNDVYVRTISSKSTEILNIRWGLTEIDKSKEDFHNMNLITLCISFIKYISLETVLTMRLKTSQKSTQNLIITNNNQILIKYQQPNKYPVHKKSSWKWKNGPQLL